MFEYVTKGKGFFCFLFYFFLCRDNSISLQKLLLSCSYPRIYTYTSWFSWVAGVMEFLAQGNNSTTMGH